MINVVYQLLRDENKTTVLSVVLSVVLAVTFLVNISTVSVDQHCQSDVGENIAAESHTPIAEVAVQGVEFNGKLSSAIVSFDIANVDIAGVDIAGVDIVSTPADLAPYSYVFYSQNYFRESIHARTPAAFALLS